MEMMAFELDPELKNRKDETAISHFMEKYGDSEEVIINRMLSIREKGIDSGLDIQYTKTKCANTFKMQSYF